jgi:hypothetical protein
MLRRLIFLAAFFLGSAALIASAQTNTYLIFSSQALCQARAQSQCNSLGCDGLQTQFWWACVGPLKSGMVGPNAVFSGSYALVVQPGTPFSATTTNAVAPSAVGLSSGEQGKLVTAAAISGVMPASSATP